MKGVVCRSRSHFRRIEIVLIALSRISLIRPSARALPSQNPKVSEKRPPFRFVCVCVTLDGSYKYLWNKTNIDNQKQYQTSTQTILKSELYVKCHFERYFPIKYKCELCKYLETSPR